MPRTVADLKREAAAAQATLVAQRVRLETITAKDRRLGGIGDEAGARSALSERRALEDEIELAEIRLDPRAHDAPLPPRFLVMRERQGLFINL